VLRFSIHRNDLRSQWRPSPNGWSAHASTIDPYRHQALEDFAVSSAARLLIVIRERLKDVSPSSEPGSANQILDLPAKLFDEKLREALEWPLQFIALLISSDEAEPKLSIFNGGWATAPVYLLESNEWLYGDWDCAGLYRYTQAKALDGDRAAHFLVSFASPYSRQTIIPDIKLLTERSTATWEANNNDSRNLQIDYPPELPSPSPRSLKPGADVLGMFQTIMQASMTRWFSDDLSIASELSSGLDSGIVSAVASAIRPESISTYGLLMPGDLGSDQQARRQELIERFRLRDRTIDALKFPPFYSEGSRLRHMRVAPWEECYYESVEAMLKLVSEDGNVCILTGVGGDELFYPHWQEMGLQEREALLEEVIYKRSEIPDFLTSVVVEAYHDSLDTLDRAPRSIIATSALEGVAHGSALYLKNGIWPINPFCTPELAWFCRSLPKQWRDNRDLQRQLLLHLGCSPKVTHPEVTESFSPVMESALRHSARPLITKLFENSCLADLGLLKPKPFLSMYSDYCDGIPVKAQDIHFYAAAVLELTVRCL
jgi:asparagine synthase (glutamine-hydrolysing)